MTNLLNAALLSDPVSSKELNRKSPKQFTEPHDTKMVTTHHAYGTRKR